MHWWQIAIRLVLILNSFGNFSEAIRASREHKYARLHWLIPKAIAWTSLFFALLPARWGGIGPSHWEFVAWCGLVLLLYGMIIWMTDASQPLLPWTQVEIPHLGSINTQVMPHFMLVVSVIGFLLVGGDIVHQRGITSKAEVLLVGFSLGLLFGVRLCLRQYSLFRLTDLIKLTALKPRLPETPAQHDWIRPEEL